MHVKEEIELSEFPNDDPIELSIEEQISEKIKPPISHEEKKAVFRFVTLFFVLGIPAGFHASVTLQLQGNGISSGQMAFWITSLYPLSFKLLLAPFVDSFYVRQFGKRRSYVIPCIYMLGFTLLTLAYNGYSGWIKNLSLYPLYGLAVLLISLQACATIATNGWVVSSMTKHYVHLGATCQMIGWALGYLVSYAVLMNLTSEYFCSQYLGLKGSLISLDDYTYLLGILVICIAIMIQCLTKEHTQEGEKSNFIDVLRSIAKVLQIGNVRLLLIFLITNRFAFAPVVASTSLNLIQMGFPQSQYAIVEAFCTTAWIISSFIVGKFLERGKEMTWVLRAYYSMFFVTACHFLFVINFMNFGGYTNITQAVYFVLQFMYEFNNSFISCTLSGFFLRIADPKIGGTYATMLFCTSSFGVQFSASVSLFLMHLFPYRTVVLLGWLYGLIYYTIMSGKLTRIQFFDLKSWRVI